MSTAGPIESREKIATIWAARREKLVAIRVYYDVFVERGCTVYALNSFEELA